MLLYMYSSGARRRHEKRAPPWGPCLVAPSRLRFLRPPSGLSQNPNFQEHSRVNHHKPTAV